MKTNIIAIIIILILLSSYSVGAQTLDQVELEYWIERLINSEDQSREQRETVDGITYYDALEGASDTFIPGILIEEESGLQLGILPGGLLAQGREEKVLLPIINFEPRVNFDNQSSFDWDFEREKYVIDYDDWRLGLDFSNQEIEFLPELGFSYQTSEQTSVFADYSKGVDDNNSKLITTAIGLEYNNDLGQYQLKYQFQDSKELESSSAEIEFELSDFAKIRAIYTLIEKEFMFEEGLGSEQQRLSSQLLDLGLDFNVNSKASFKLGYQLIDKELDEENLSEESLIDKLRPNAADIKLEMKF